MVKVGVVVMQVVVVAEVGGKGDNICSGRVTLSDPDMLVIKKLMFMMLELRLI